MEATPVDEYFEIFIPSYENSVDKMMHDINLKR